MGSEKLALVVLVLMRVGEKLPVGSWHPGAKYPMEQTPRDAVMPSCPGNVAVPRGYMGAVTALTKVTPGEHPHAECQQQPIGSG